MPTVTHVRGTASLGPGLWPPQQGPGEQEDPVTGQEDPVTGQEDPVGRRKSASAAKKVWTGGPREAYRMQVTEAACWSFMLFLRSRMLSEDWYTWTLWIRVCTCDKC